MHWENVLFVFNQVFFFFFAHLLRSFISYTHLHTHNALWTFKRLNISQIYLNQKILQQNGCIFWIPFKEMLNYILLDLCSTLGFSHVSVWTWNDERKHWDATGILDYNSGCMHCLHITDRKLRLWKIEQYAWDLKPNCLDTAPLTVSIIALHLWNENHSDCSIFLAWSRGC